MMSGTVILAHRSAGVRRELAAAIHERLRCVRVEQADQGSNLMLMQAALRADAILVDMDMPDMPGSMLLRELRGDIVHPYLLASSRDGSRQAEIRALRMGASAYEAEPFSTEKMCDLIEVQLELRAGHESAAGIFMAEKKLQRMFTEQGIPSSLKGYTYLKQAVRLIDAGEEDCLSIGRLYDRIALRFGCHAEAVEHSIRYAIQMCWQRGNVPGERCPSNKQFLAFLMEEGLEADRAQFEPRVSLYVGERRIFR